MNTQNHEQPEFPFVEVFTDQGLFFARREWDGVDCEPRTVTGSVWHVPAMAANMLYGETGVKLPTIEGLVYQS